MRNHNNYKPRMDTNGHESDFGNQDYLKIRVHLRPFVVLISSLKS